MSDKIYFKTLQSDIDLGCPDVCLNYKSRKAAFETIKKDAAVCRVPLDSLKWYELSAESGWEDSEEWEELGDAQDFIEGYR